MKKQLLSFIAIAGFTFAGFTQCIIDPNFTDSAFAIQPDTNVNFKCATAGQIYNDTMQFKLPSKVGDLEPDHIAAAAPIDSVKFVGANGLPTGFAAITDNPRNTWPGGANGCALITGQNSTVGTYNITIDVIAYIPGVPPEGRSFGGYKIDVMTTCPVVSVNEIKATSFSLSQNRPNPFSFNSAIEFKSQNSAVYELTISNLLGEVVNSRTIFATSGVNIVNISSEDLPTGIYTYSLSNGSEVATKRMIVAGK